MTKLASRSAIDIASLVSLGVGITCLIAILAWATNRSSDSAREWRKAMFAATTPLGIDDHVNSEAIRIFASSYAMCVFSPPPAVDRECAEEAAGILSKRRSEEASPERIAAEREVVLSLLDHVNAGAADQVVPQ